MITDDVEWLTKHTRMTFWFVVIDVVCLLYNVIVFDVNSLISWFAVGFVTYLTADMYTKWRYWRRQLKELTGGES